MELSNSLSKPHRRDVSACFAVFAAFHAVQCTKSIWEGLGKRLLGEGGARAFQLGHLAIAHSPHVHGYLGIQLAARDRHAGPP